MSDRSPVRSTLSFSIRAISAFLASSAPCADVAFAAAPTTVDAACTSGDVTLVLPQGDMTYRLQDGALEVRTTITNHSAEAMPVSIGFHPYYQLSDSPRDEWQLTVGARTHWLLAQNKVPTGETEPIEKIFPDPRAASLRAADLDDVFGDLVRDGQGRATMAIVGKSQRLDLVLGANYRSVVIWAPKDRDFICVEPMAGITDAINLAHKGQYKELQSIAPGGTWRESFWIKPSGF